MDRMSGNRTNFRSQGRIVMARFSMDPSIPPSISDQMHAKYGDPNRQASITERQLAFGQVHLSMHERIVLAERALTGLLDLSIRPLDGANKALSEMTLDAMAELLEGFEALHRSAMTIHAYVAHRVQAVEKIVRIDIERAPFGPWMVRDDGGDCGGAREFVSYQGAYEDAESRFDYYERIACHRAPENKDYVVRVFRNGDDITLSVRDEA